MRETLNEYRVDCDKVSIFCDNERAIKIAYNPVQHSRTKHTEIRNHFIRDHVAYGDIELAYVCTKDQLVDIFIKPLDEARFGFLRNELNIIDSRRWLEHRANTPIFQSLIGLDVGMEIGGLLS
jgi:hypothetical protein